MECVYFLYEQLSWLTLVLFLKGGTCKEVENIDCLDWALLGISFAGSLHRKKEKESHLQKPSRQWLTIRLTLPKWSHVHLLESSILAWGTSSTICECNLSFICLQSTLSIVFISHCNWSKSQNWCEHKYFAPTMINSSCNPYFIKLLPNVFMPSFFALV